MLPTITTTHAVPQQLPPTRPMASSNELHCDYCFKPLGTYSNPMERIRRKSAHRCKAKSQAKLPASCVPFN